MKRKVCRALITKFLHHSSPLSFDSHLHISLNTIYHLLSKKWMSKTLIKIIKNYYKILKIQKPRMIKWKLYYFYSYTLIELLQKNDGKPSKIMMKKFSFKFFTTRNKKQNRKNSIKTSQWIIIIEHSLRFISLLLSSWSSSSSSSCVSYYISEFMYFSWRY